MYKRPCFLQKNTAVQVLRQGLKTNKQEQETNKQKQKKMGKAGNLYTRTQDIGRFYARDVKVV